MAETNPQASVTPVATPTAAPDIPAAVPATPTPIPTLSGQDATMAQVAPLEAEAGQHYKNAADLGKPAVPAPVAHARLARMVQGLTEGLTAGGLGLSAFGTAIATHGQAGGASEVIQAQGEQQRQKIEAQQAALAQKNQQIQQQITLGDTAHKQAQNIFLMAQMPDELAKSHFETQAAGLTVAGEAQRQAGETVKQAAEKFDLFANTGMNAAQIDQLVSGGAVDAKTSGILQQNADQQYRLASQILPSDNPSVKLLKAAMDEGSPQNIVRASRMLQNEVAGQEKINSAKTAKEAAEANSPVGKLSTPDALAAPGAVDAIKAKLADPHTDPADVDRLQSLIPRAQLAQKNALAFDAAKARQQEAITNGDPKSAGALLYSGLVSPQELISSRKPEFAQAAFDEAIRLSGGVKGADGKWVANPNNWSAVKAESQYEYAKHPQTQNTLNLLTTMQQPGGSIDIAQKTFGTLPGKMDVNTFNKIVDGTSTEFGGKAVPAFAAAMTSLADEYAQVLQGGAATETTLRQAKDLIKQAYSQQQGEAAFATIRQDMAARQTGMVRDNPALMSMYPPPPKPAGAGVTVTDPRGTVHTFPDQASADKFKSLAGIK